MNKFTDIFKIASAVAKPVAPGFVGPILDAVNQSIEDKTDTSNLKALEAMARRIDEMTTVIEHQHAEIQELKK